MRHYPFIRNFKQYFWKNLVPALVIATGGILFLNFFLAYRLENYLKEEVKERVAEASDGFYSLTFDDLSINLLNGELKIEGLQLIPDSIIFVKWRAKDSLPLTYVEASIREIEFTGVNLIWLKNYRRLNFRTFEIKQPLVHVTDAFYSDRHEKKEPPKRSKTLHEYIEPYIDILSVKQINVEQASVAFDVEHPLTPILYKIEDIDFYAYNFRLDSASYKNGHLLYSENFEFISDQPQTIITNNQFLLETGTILLNTKDSLIYMKEIRLLPQQPPVHDSLAINRNYVKGEIDLVRAEGAAFKRVNAFNTMQAQNLWVEASDISIFTDNPPKDPAKMQQDSTEQKSTLSVLSLYDLISPVLNRLEIEMVDVRNSRFNLIAFHETDSDRISIDNLDMTARHFLIDSLYEKRNGFRYSREIRLAANDVEAYLPSSNYQMRLDTLILDSEKEIFLLKNSFLEPISKRSPDSFVAGTIPSFSIYGIKYTNGLALGNVSLKAPDIRYYSSTRKNSGNTGTVFSNYFRYLTIQEIEIEKGNFIFADRIKKDNWQLGNIDAFLGGFKTDEIILKQPGSMGFLCDQLEFRIRNFDNSIENGNYRLKIDDGSFSNRSGLLEIKNIALTPQNRKNIPGTSFFEFHIPSLTVNGLKDILKKPGYLRADSLSIKDPVVTITSGTSSDSSVEKKAAQYTPFQPFRTLDIRHIDIDNTRLNYKAGGGENHLSIEYEELNIDRLAWNLEKEREINISNFEVYSPRVNWLVTTIDTTSINETDTANLPKAIPELLYPYAEKLLLERLFVENIQLTTTQPYLSTAIQATHFALGHLQWGFQEENKKMEIEALSILEPEIEINRKPSPVLTSSQESDTIKTSIYEQIQIIGDEIHIKEADVIKGEISFTQLTSDNKEKKQKINQTDFRITDLEINNNQEKFSYQDVRLTTKDLSVPIDGGFYTLDIANAELKNKDLTIENFHLNPAYPKETFAYMHPRHKDWFDVTFDRLEIKDIDLGGLFSDSILYASEVIVDHPVMKNFKNKKIYVAPKWMPMMYTAIQKAPIPINIEKIQVNNFHVIYEELAKKGIEPGKLVFTELNGTITGFTNIVSYPEQYIRLDADGKFYGEGHFNALWLLPVDSLNDHFILQAHLPDMDLTLLNEMITPLASAQLKEGQLTDLTFRMDAGHIGGTIDMLFLYRDLKVDIFQIKDGEKKSKKFLNFLVNAVVRDNNPNQPDHPRSKPRHPVAEVIRDPYHSSFNYLWQLLRPALTESVGISKTQQKIAGGVVKFITKVKKIFEKDKKEKEAAEINKPPQTD